MWSSEVHDTLRIYVARCGPEPRAVLVVTDGNGLFGLAVSTVGLMQLPRLVPSLLVVGIGYPSAHMLADTVALRNRDLTPTASAAFAGSGGADAFLRFIRAELTPWVERHHLGGPAESIYFGHSLGGLFGTYVMLSEPSSFDHYIIGSPSLWWDHYWIFDYEAEQALRRSDLAAKVFVGIGGDETDEGRRREGRGLPDGHPLKPVRTHLDMVADLGRFNRALRGRHYPTLELADAVFPGEFHVTVPGTVLTHGLRQVFNT